LREEDLQKYLDEVGVRAEILRLKTKVKTVSQAASALGVNRDKIIKTIMFVDSSENPILAVVSGGDRIDLDRLAKVVGSSVRMATPDEVKEHTGYAVGGLPPVGHKKPIRTIVDPKVLRKSQVYGGGGSDSSLLKISPQDIVRLQNAEVKSVVEG